MRHSIIIQTVSVNPCLWAAIPDTIALFYPYITATMVKEEFNAIIYLVLGLGSNKHSGNSETIETAYPVVNM